MTDTTVLPDTTQPQTTQSQTDQPQTDQPQTDQPQTDQPGTRPETVARLSLDLWLTMWNGDADLARTLCADDFRIHFAVTERDGSTPADGIRTAEDFARYLEWWHQEHRGTVFTAVADAIDGEHGRLLWDVEADGALAGGVDVFDFAADGRVSRLWSVGGRRSMRG